MPYILTESGDRLLIETGFALLTTEDSTLIIDSVILVFDAMPRTYAFSPVRQFTFDAGQRS